MNEAQTDDAIYMINALWFTQNGGRERYQQYASALTPLLEKAGATFTNSLALDSVIVGDWNPDLVIVVRYPNFAAFEALTTSPAFAAIKPLREGALEKSQLIRCRASAFTGNT